MRRSTVTMRLAGTCMIAAVLVGLGPLSAFGLTLAEIGDETIIVSYHDPNEQPIGHIRVLGRDAQTFPDFLEALGRPVSALTGEKGLRYDLMEPGAALVSTGTELQKAIDGGDQYAFVFDSDETPPAIYRLSDWSVTAVAASIALPKPAADLLRRKTAGSGPPLAPDYAGPLLLAKGSLTDLQSASCVAPFSHNTGALKAEIAVQIMQKAGATAVRECTEPPSETLAPAKGLFLAAGEFRMKQVPFLFTLSPDANLFTFKAALRFERVDASPVEDALSFLAPPKTTGEVKASCVDTDVTDAVQVYDCLSLADQTNGTRVPSNHDGCFIVDGIYRQLVATAQKAAGRRMEDEEIEALPRPTCSVYAAALQEFYGSPPPWAPCLDYSPERKGEHFAACVRAYYLDYKRMSQEQFTQTVSSFGCDELIHVYYRLAMPMAYLPHKFGNQMVRLPPDITEIDCSEIPNF